ncbi:MAG: 50S ribosomal protein L23 [Verrucomicrobiota bacterium]|nr:50S ribosomal protein L23 [Verrucomicrobiota bacterium]
MKDPFDVIKKVRLTEKGSFLSEKYNKYVFEVAPSANKVEIKNAIQKLFGKKVLSVNTQNYFGKARRKRTAQSGKKSDWKKAIVTLKQGEKIEVI